MKKYLLALSSLFIVALMVSCEKPYVINDTAKIDVANANAIYRSEPIIFTFSQVASTASVSWTVSPNNSVSIQSAGNTASIQFAKAGQYIVSASSGSLSGSTSVVVKDSIKNTPPNTTPPANTTTPLVAGEKINIQVARIDSGANAGLMFTAKTLSTYNCLNNKLIAEAKFGTQEVNIKYTGVTIPSPCTNGTAIATGFSYLFPIGAGTHALNITLNGAVYKGTIVKNGNSFTIELAANDFVTISPKTL